MQNVRGEGILELCDLHWKWKAEASLNADASHEEVPSVCGKRKAAMSNLRWQWVRQENHVYWMTRSNASAYRAASPILEGGRLREALKRASTRWPRVGLATDASDAAGCLSSHSSDGSILRARIGVELLLMSLELNGLHGVSLSVPVYS